MAPRIVEGDLLEQDVEVIVNSWNRNLIPWWLLLPSGVSGAIKRRAGTAAPRSSVLDWMREELARASFAGEVRIVRYRLK